MDAFRCPYSGLISKTAASKKLELLSRILFILKASALHSKHRNKELPKLLPDPRSRYLQMFKVPSEASSSSSSSYLRRGRRCIVASEAIGRLRVPPDLNKPRLAGRSRGKRDLVFVTRPNFILCQCRTASGLYTLASADPNSTRNIRIHQFV